MVDLANQLVFSEVSPQSVILLTEEVLFAIEEPVVSNPRVGVTG
jgi:hypothetical protein